MARPFLAPFRRLLRLAGSRWRYSTPPPHGLMSTSSFPSALCLYINDYSPSFSFLLFSVLRKLGEENQLRSSPFIICSNLLLLPLPYYQIIFSFGCFQTPSIYMLPSERDIDFRIQQVNLFLYSLI
jgi:hypothetical protein